MLSAYKTAGTTQFANAGEQWVALNYCTEVQITQKRGYNILLSGTSLSSDHTRETPPGGTSESQIGVIMKGLNEQKQTFIYRETSLFYPTVSPFKIKSKPDLKLMKAAKREWLGWE